MNLYDTKENDLLKHIDDGNIDGVRGLIKDVNIDFQGCEPLLLSIKKGNLEIIELLLQNGAAIQNRNIINRALLNVDVIKCMENNGVDINMFELASYLDKEDLSGLKYLEKKIDLTKIDIALLTQAAYINHYEVIKFFIDIGYDINKNNSIIIQTAMKRKNIDIVNLLLDNGSLIVLEDLNTAINFCSLYGMKLFNTIRNKIDLNKCGEIMLYGYISIGYFHMADYLLSIGVKIDNLSTFLFESDNVNILHYLKNKVNVYANEEILLHCIKKQYVNCTIQFFNNGADLNKYSEFIITSFFQKIYPMVKYMISRGFDVHAHDDLILKRSVLYRSLDAVIYLLENGIDVNQYKNKILQYAVNVDFYEIIDYILEKGADVGAVNVNMILYYNKTKVIMHLINSGFNFNKNNEEYFMNIVNLEVLKRVINDGYNYVPLLNQYIDNLIQKDNAKDYVIVEYLLDLENNLELTNYALSKYIKYFKYDVNSKSHYHGYQFLTFLAKMGASITDDVIQIIPKTEDEEILNFIIGLGIEVPFDKLLLEAVDNVNTSMIKMLINKGASINCDYIWKNIANYKYDNTFIRSLISQGVDIRSNNDEALFQCLNKGNYDKIIILLENGLPIRVYDDIILRSLIKSDLKNNYLSVIKLHQFLKYYVLDEFKDVVMNFDCKDQYAKIIKDNKCELSDKVKELNFNII